MNVTHNRTNTKEYRAWSSMKSRCSNPNVASYPNYGGRGITVCDRWLNSFENFFEDMGEAPEGFELDRIDVNGNYTPDNCRWVDESTQAKNRRIRIPPLSNDPMRCIHLTAFGSYEVRIRLNKQKRIQQTFATLEEAIEWRNATEYERQFQRMLGMR